MENLGFLVDSFDQATQGWLPEAVNAAVTIFQRLAAIELVVFGLVVAVKSRGPGAADVLPSLAWKLFLIGMLFTGLLLYPYWIPVIGQSFAELAGAITGFDTLDPVVLTQQGLTLAVQLFATATSSGWLFGTSPLGALVGGAGALGVALAFIAIGGILLKTLIESWIVVAAGPLFLGFAPFRWTAQLADNFLAYAFEVAIKFFLLILMAAAVGNVAAVWAAALVNSDGASFELVLEILAGSVLMAISLWTVPTRMADVLTRGLSFGLRQGLSD